MHNLIKLLAGLSAMVVAATAPSHAASVIPANSTAVAVIHAHENENHYFTEAGEDGSGDFYLNAGRHVPEIYVHLACGLAFSNYADKDYAGRAIASITRSVLADYGYHNRGDCAAGIWRAFAEKRYIDNADGSVTGHSGTWLTDEGGGIPHGEIAKVKEFGSHFFLLMRCANWHGEINADIGSFAEFYELGLAEFKAGVTRSGVCGKGDGKDRGPYDNGHYVYPPDEPLPVAPPPPPLDPNITLH